MRYVFKTKAEIIAKLEEQRPAAEAADKATVAAHRKEEAEYLKAFRQALREAMKWTYEEAKKREFSAYVENENNSWRSRRKAPSCPVLRVADLDRAIAMASRLSDHQKRFVISGNGMYSEIYRALTDNIPEAKGVC